MTQKGTPQQSKMPTFLTRTPLIEIYQVIQVAVSAPHKNGSCTRNTHLRKSQRNLPLGPMFLPTASGWHKVLDLNADGVTNAQTLEGSVTTKIKRRDETKKAPTNCLTAWTQVSTKTMSSFCSSENTSATRHKPDKFIETSHQNWRN